MHPGLSIATLTLWLASAATPSGPVVAVFAIENRGTDLTPGDLEALTDYLATRLGEGGRFRIIPREEIRARLSEQKKESHKECYDQSCQIEIGRELAAGLTLSAGIGKIGNQCLITVALYDLEKAAAIRTASARGSCNADDLIVALDGMVPRLQGLEEKKAEPPAVVLETKEEREPPLSVGYAILWSLIPTCGMYYVGETGWGLFYLSLFLGGAAVATALSQTEGAANVGGLVGGLTVAGGYFGSMIHSALVASDSQDAAGAQANTLRDFKSVPALAPGGEVHRTWVLPIFSGRF